MIFLFKFLLLVILMAVVMVAVVAFTVYRRLHSVVNRFRGQSDDSASSGQRSQSQAGSQRVWQTSEGESLTDERSPEEADRKIFAKDEGEYVDFEEIR